MVRKLDEMATALQPQRGRSIQPRVGAPVAVRKHLRCVNRQNENNARCGGGRRTAKYAKYANGNSVLIFAWFVWFGVQKRWRATAVQDAGAFTVTFGWREASWSAPALWRFGWWWI